MAYGRKKRSTRVPGWLACLLLTVLTATGCVMPVAMEPAAAETQASLPPLTREGFFALDHVLEVDIEIAPEHWDTLRHQSRTLQDLFSDPDCLAQPFPSIFTWFPATVTVDGETLPQVGVRKKGFIGSLSTTKPALKIRFDKYVDDQLLGGSMERMTLNNSVQDDSRLRTCLAYQVFDAAGLPAPQCSFATVAVNGEDMGLYVHVEDIRTSLVARTFENPEGNLYEGTVSDFRPEWRGTIEKKTHEDAADWSDVEAVVAALADPSPAGLDALAAAVDLDRFLTFWATETLVGHWDGYAGDLNNYWFYREPDGAIVFIPWGTDGTFETNDNPFDDFESPPSVMARGAIAHRLYQDDAYRAAYVERLGHLLDTVWPEAELLARIDRMAAIVQEHERPAARAAAARDTAGVRRYVSDRRAAILADWDPEPPAWPWPLPEAEICGWGAYMDAGPVDPFTVEVEFQTLWGSKESEDPFGEWPGTVTALWMDGAEIPVSNTVATAGLTNAREASDIGVEEAALLSFMSLGPDFTLEGLTVWLPPDRMADDVRLVLGAEGVGGIAWSLAPGAVIPTYTPLEGVLELTAASMEPGATVAGQFSGTVQGGAEEDAVAEEDEPETDVPGLIINEVAAQGDPLDWFELHNHSDVPVALSDLVLADDLRDAGKRTAFPEDWEPLPPGAYRQITLDKEGWPGFALGRDEELGIWTRDGQLVDQIDWEEGQADEGTSYARLPDVKGDFQTVDNPTPGAPNEAPE